MRDVLGRIASDLHAFGLLLEIFRSSFVSFITQSPHPLFLSAGPEAEFARPWSFDIFTGGRATRRGLVEMTDDGEPTASMDWPGA